MEHFHQHNLKSPPTQADSYFSLSFKEITLNLHDYLLLEKHIEHCWTEYCLCLLY